MATVPTTKQIADNIIASFEANYGEKIPILKKAFLRVVAKVFAGLYIILYKYTGFLGLQIFISTCSAEETVINGKTVIPLVEWGRLLGVGDPAPAQFAKLEIEITVINQTGFIPSGTALFSPVNNVTYITEGSILLDAATVTGIVISSADQQGGNGAGLIGNLDAGDPISFISPIDNVEQDCEVLSRTQDGVDAEDLDTEYRQRVIDYVQAPPQGGAYADYAIWGLEVDGIIGIFPYTDLPGDVVVYAEATPTSSGNPDGIPTPEQLDLVLQSIERNNVTDKATRRPAGTFVNVIGIIRLGFDVEVFDLVVEDIGVVRAEIEEAVKDYFLSLEPFIDGLSVKPRRDKVTRSAVAGVVQDVVSARGGIFSSLDVTLTGTEILVYSLGGGTKAKLSSITFSG